MNVIEQAHQAYAPTQTSIRSDRSVEAQLISQITARLRKANTGLRADFPALVAALHENRRMWVTMAAGVADAENALPQALRAQLFYLAEFTEHHSALVIKRLADVTPLVDINTAVMRGLNAQRQS
ncbi:flagellar biosynthesis regulator FlaF [Yoonia sp. F2084L]|uniref:flagellar biosynthesis regulator FlaF n=1 Tax=Yoonia sp. F2084L TaxID=2926419 RepID=UPI001FF5AB5E|nr:flagellar biosynthesis regulator FlaF [Yoonia sp. F2084L]